MKFWMIIAWVAAGLAGIMALGALNIFLRYGSVMPAMAPLLVAGMFWLVFLANRSVARRVRKANEDKV